MAEFGVINIIEGREIKEDIFKIIEKDKVLVVDAMLGTGVRGELREPFKTIVEKLNKAKEKNKNLFIVSVDVETGNLKSDLTITFHKKKTINKKEPIVKDIGIPKLAEYIVGFGDLRALNKKRGEYKGKNGKVLIIGGSREFYGAPILAGLSALKFVDIVGILSVKEVTKKANHPEFIYYKVGEKYLSVDYIDDILEIAEKYDVVVLGNGLGLNNETKKFVNEFLKRYSKKVVIDADAIKLINYDNFNFEDRFIFTPHKKEYEYIKYNLKNLKSTILLKGRYDIIFNYEKIKINKTGNSGLTKGGTGDILAGLTGALFTKNEAFLSACCSAFIIGYAGDLLLKEKGFNYTPLEVIEKIPNVTKLFGIL